MHLLDTIDPALSVIISGDEKTGRKHGGIAFHLPIFGGWKKYVVLETTKKYEAWHVGWIVRLTNDNSVVRFQLHTLPIFDTRVRLLTGTQKYTITFFAIEKTGSQVPLREIDRGEIGDRTYHNVRLF